MRSTRRFLRHSSGLIYDRPEAGHGQGRAHRGRWDHGGQRGRCATSCGGTGRTGGCQARLGPGEPASRLPRPRTWRAWTASVRASSARTGSRRATRVPTSDRAVEGRHDPSGLQAVRARGVDLRTDRGGGRRAKHPADAGRSRRTLEKTLKRIGQAQENLEAVDRHRRPRSRPNVCRQGLSGTVGLKGARRVMAAWKTGWSISELQAERFLRHGTATGRPAGQSPTTGPGVIGRGQGSLQAACRDRRARPLRTPSIASGMPGHGCAGARTCTSDTGLSPATI